MGLVADMKPRRSRVVLDAVVTLLKLDVAALEKAHDAA